MVIEIFKEYIINKVNWLNLDSINFTIIVGIKDFIVKNNTYEILESLYNECFKCWLQELCIITEN